MELRKSARSPTTTNTVSLKVNLVWYVAHHVKGKTVGCQEIEYLLSEMKYFFNLKWGWKNILSFFFFFFSTWAKDLIGRSQFQKSRKAKLATGIVAVKCLFSHLLQYNWNFYDADIKWQKEVRYTLSCQELGKMSDTILMSKKKNVDAVRSRLNQISEHYRCW